ncbi:MAG: endonuclease/exonuclease/phosphatase family protein [Planctomycetaceae bacterium]
MKHVIVALLAGLSLGADQAADPAAAISTSVKVMSWNIRYDNPRDGVNAWGRRKDWVAQIINAEQVDIVGAQEVLSRQFDFLSQKLPEMSVYGVGRDDAKKRGEFAPIFFRKERFELLAKSTFWLSPTPEKPGSRGWDAAITRIASWVKLRDRRTSATFYAVNTRYDHRGPDARAQSSRLLIRRLNEQFQDHPVVLTGDFNTLPGTRPYNTLVTADPQKRRFFRDAFKITQQRPQGPNSTWNGFRAVVPNRRIDFGFVTGTIGVRQLKVLNQQRDGRFPSDHLPVVTVIEFPGKSSAAP